MVPKQQQVPQKWVPPQKVFTLVPREPHTKWVSSVGDQNLLVYDNGESYANTTVLRV